MTVSNIFSTDSISSSRGTTPSHRRGSATSNDAEAGLIRLPTPEEHAYAEALADLETRRQRAADLQVEYETLKVHLGRFEAEYHARVGHLFVELDRVRLACDECGRRIARLRTNLRSSLEELDDDVSEAFSKRRARLHAEEAESRRYQRTHAEAQRQPTLAPDEEAELKRIYRELARRYHPDLARSDDHRQQCEERMLRINAAYRDRDLSGLRDIATSCEQDSPAFARQTATKRLEWARAELTRIEGVIVGLAEAIRRTRASDTHQLWQRAQADSGLLDRLATGITRELEHARQQFVNLQSTYDGIVAERAGR